jgi:hypothetical protein
MNKKKGNRIGNHGKRRSHLSLCGTKRKKKHQNEKDDQLLDAEVVIEGIEHAVTVEVNAC